MRDADIRRALENRLTEQHGDDPSTMIRHELGLCSGSRRVDLAVVNGHLAGWEIKSDFDTLKRLAGQAVVYNRVFDRLSIVTTSKHLQHAMDALPEWWGVVRAEGSDSSVHLRNVRQPRTNPGIDPMAVAQLLWRDEALEELRQRGLAVGLSGKARWYIWERLVEELKPRELKAVVRDRLRARPVWPDVRSQ